MLPSWHEQIISETRAVQEAAIRLGPGATSADIQKFLEEEGLCVSLDFIDHVRTHQTKETLP